MVRMRTGVALLCTVSVLASLTSAVDDLKLELASVVSQCVEGGAFKAWTDVHCM